MYRLALVPLFFACAVSDGKPADSGSVSCGAGTHLEGGVCVADGATGNPSDADGDGYGSSIDCDDTSSVVNPGAPEVCDGVDNDCSGTADDDASDAPTWYADVDADGFGDPTAAASGCQQPAGYVADATDCDGTTAEISPGAVEVCDAGYVDEDCDGSAACGGDSGGGDTGGGDTGGSGSYTVCDDGIAPYADIQDAVDDASQGDVINVCAGTYGPVEVFAGTEVTLVGDGVETTTIAGGAAGAVLVDEGKLTMSGFSVRGTGAGGGGLSAYGGAFSVENDGTLAVSDARVDYSGGYIMVYVSGGYLTFDGVLFENNFMSSSGYLFYFTGRGEVVFRHNVVRSSAASIIWNSNTLDVDATNNIFYDIEYSSTYAFTPDTSYGGSQAIENNVFYDIDATSPDYSSFFYAGALTNNIIAGCNAAMESRSASVYSIYWDNGASYSSAGSWNSISSNPQFTDPTSGDFTLRAGYSPGIDGGDPSGAYDDPDGTRNDIGAFGGPYGDWTP